MFSAAIPALIMDGHLTEQLQFPSWFGRYSNAGKRQRLMRQLSYHAHLKFLKIVYVYNINFSISGSNQALVVDYLPVLRDRLYQPLIKNFKDKVEQQSAIRFIIFILF